MPGPPACLMMRKRFFHVSDTSRLSMSASVSSTSATLAPGGAYGFGVSILGSPRRAAGQGQAARLDAFRHPVFYRLERLRQLRHIGAARLRHVGAAATLAAHLLSDMVHELARFHFRSEVRRNTRDQRHLAVV